MKTFLILIQTLVFFRISAHAAIPADYQAMRQCQESAAATPKPFQFIDALKFRGDISTSLKKNCIEFLLVRNNFIDIHEDEVERFVKSLLDVTNSSLSSIQIFEKMKGKSTEQPNVPSNPHSVDPTVSRAKTFVVQRQPFQMKILKDLVGERMAITISNSVYSSSAGMWGTWTVLSMQGRPYFLTAGHVSRHVLGMYAAKAPPAENSSILQAQDLLLIKKGEGQGQIQMSAKIHQLVGSVDISFPPQNDFSLAAVLPNKLSAEKERLVRSGQIHPMNLKFSDFNDYTDDLKDILSDQMNSPLKISVNPVHDTEVFTVGYPKGIGHSISTGRVVGAEIMKMDPSDGRIPFNPDVEFMVHMLVSEGNSGGPVFDRQGRLLGILVRGNGDAGAKQEEAQPGHYARVVKIDYILKSALKSFRSQNSGSDAVTTLDQVLKDFSSLAKDN